MTSLQKRELRKLYQNLSNEEFKKKVKEIDDIRMEKDEQKRKSKRENFRYMTKEMLEVVFFYSSVILKLQEIGKSDFFNRTKELFQIYPTEKDCEDFMAIGADGFWKNLYDCSDSENNAICERVKKEIMSNIGWHENILDYELKQWCKFRVTMTS